MLDLHFPLAAQIPAWWDQMIQQINVWVLGFSRFVGSLSAFQIMTVAIGFWIVAIKPWFRQFSEGVNRAYWIVIWVYAAFCFLVLAGKF